MNDKSSRRYWTQQASTSAGPPEATKAPPRGELAAISRRQFLEAAGFTLGVSAIVGCDNSPAQFALPFAVAPEGVIPGRTVSYASTCAGCSAACGLLVGVRDGRPLKMEGLKEHPLSHGGLCAMGQALPLGLYDSRRLTQPLHKGQPTNWSEVDRAIASKLQQISDRGGAVRFVTSTVTSPTLKASLDAFLKSYADARHVTFDAVSCSAILDAHEKTHGVRALPHYKLDQARVIVAFGADFLGAWISPVEFTAAWRSRRVPTVERPQMSHHIQLEGRMSLTGSNADRRYRLAPDEYGVVLSHLAARLSALAGQATPPGELGTSPLAAAELANIAQRLWDARGESVVLCDSQDVSVQLLVNFINQILGNYSSTVDLVRPSRQRQGSDGDILKLIEELKAGQVSALFVAGTDLTHNLPDHDSLAVAIGKVPLVVSFAERADDFASLSEFVCPEPHPLESWGDAEPVSGLMSFTQPTLQPLANTRSMLESLARWSGHGDSAYEILRTSWKARAPVGDGSPSFDSWWDKALQDGFVELAQPPGAPIEFKADAVRLLGDRSPQSEVVLQLYSKVGLGDSRHAHNAWLQELPDPVTKVTWDNYVCVSPTFAEKLGLSNGDVVRVATAEDGFAAELPIFIQPGQHDRVVAVALGYGVLGTDRFANIGPQWLEARPTVAPGELVGKNVAGFIVADNGTLRYTQPGVKLTRTGRRHDLAVTQQYHSLTVPAHVAPHGAEVRDAVQETSLAEFIKNPHAGAPEQHHAQQQLWPEDHPQTGHSWAMVIDLNACTGCSACLIACQAENNVPVVGKDEVRRQREMHWIRIDRYYAGETDDVEVVHQPMMCQHCDNAPCETVCPVLATVHSDEGLNEQVYNRCVGTRYCANNCPYKVRRFNWFRYDHPDSLQNLVLNPDVTVRTRGVMEKCSMCVQRIEEQKIAARQRREPLADGAIQTACQQSCPAQAIVFGDRNDADSRVAAALQNPRHYRVLEEFNFRPAVAYLRVVRNRDGENSPGGEHG